MKINLLVFLMFLSFNVQAYYPSTQWSSQKIPEQIIGLKTGSVLQPSSNDIVTLSPEGVAVYQLNGDKLVKQFEAKASRYEKFIHLALFDVDQDGRDEILVTGMYRDRLFSFVGFVEGGKLKRKSSLSYYLEVIEWMGQKLIVAQKKLGNDDFNGPLMQMEWKGKKLVKKQDIILPGKLSDQTFSLYSLMGLKLDGQDDLLYLSSKTGNFLLYQQTQPEKWSKKWTSGGDYGGSVYYLDLKIKNFLNQIENNRFFIPVGFHHNQKWSRWVHPSLPSKYCPDPALIVEEEKKSKEKNKKKVEAKNSEAEDLPTCLPYGWIPQPHPGKKLKLYVMKNSGYLKNVVGAVPSIKHSQMVRLTWTGHGFQEDWNSPRLDGAISDFVVLDWDSDGREDILASFILRDGGYWDTLKQQDSLLVVLKPGDDS